MKSLFGLLILAMIMVCVSYSEAQELKTAQDDTTLPTKPNVILIVDRNPHVQTLQVIENGVHTKTFPVSTGRETFDFNTGNYKINPYCSFTQTNAEYAKESGGKGFKDFKVNRLREMNISDSWSSRDKDGNITSKTAMPFAVFYNGGTAFHAVDTEAAVAKLGPKKSPDDGGSGACVRLDRSNAQYVFDLFATKKEDGSYDKADPRQWEECQVPAGQTMSHKCTDPEQWPVPRKKQDVEIKIIDSRPQSEQDAANKKCDDTKQAFLADKAKCLDDKVRALQPQASAPVAPVKSPRPKVRFFQKIGNFFSGKKQQEADEASAAAVVSSSFDFKKDWSTIPVELRIKFNEECNMEGHQKIKAAGTIAPAVKMMSTVAAPAATLPKAQTAPPAKPKGLWMNSTN